MQQKKNLLPRDEVILRICATLQWNNVILLILRYFDARAHE
jgi:hypothetical protein